MFRHYRFRFVIDRSGFSVAFTQSDTYTDKGIQLPVTVTGLLGVELIRQGVGIRFDVNRQAVIQTKVATKTETSGNEKLTFLPEIFHLISTGIERICFVIVKTTVQSYSTKKIAVEHTLRMSLIYITVDAGIPRPCLKNTAFMAQNQGMRLLFR